MKFKRRATSKNLVRATVDLTPLIDVVFQLLLFFMLTSTFVVQSSIPVELSKSDFSEKLEQKEATVTLSYGEGGPDNQGEVFYTEDEDVPIKSWHELTRALENFYARKPDGLLLIRPDRRVPTERLVKVLGIANSVGIKHYGIAAIPSKTETTQ
ncbi:MAG TPA: biopolymer transporter ExbD [Candidatus Hydrogenedens sp.]|nr:biopolymer transporter ExbD [Candidatus Hydrogenedens sp.]